MKALVKVGLAAITIAFLIGVAGFLIPSLSQTGASILDDVEWGNIEINFNKSYNSITYQEFEFYIKQNYSATGLKVNISNIINETNFGINDLNRIEFYTREKVSYNYNRVSFTYSEGSNNTGLNLTNLDSNYIRVGYPNGTFVDVAKSTVWNFKEHSTEGWYTLNQSNPVTEILTAEKWIWEETKDATLNKNIGTQKATTKESTITIPKLSDVDEYGNNGTKWFKIVIYTPIADHNDGWGSKGSFAVRLDDANSGYEKHPPWDGSWDKRKPITFTNAQQLQNVEIEFNVTWETGMQTDFDDLRFVNASNNQEIPFAILDRVPGAWARGYVRMNTTAGNETQGYLYFDNPSATTAANNYTTFELYDDFYGSSIDTNIWNSSVTGSITVRDGHAIFERSNIASLKTFGQDFVVEANVTFSGSLTHQMGFFAGASGVGAGLDCQGGQPASSCASIGTVGAGGNQLRLFTKAAGSDTATQIVAVELGTGYELLVWRKSSDTSANGTSYTRGTANEITNINRASTTTNVPTSGMYVAVGTHLTDTGINTTVDWIRVTKYVSSYPVIAFGTTESGLSVTQHDTILSTIETAIGASLGSDAPIYTDQQIYARYLNTTQQLARFDKVTKFGNQIWAFTYVNDSAPFTNMQNITPAFYVREFANMTPDDVQTLVSDFINKTKVS